MTWSHTPHNWNRSQTRRSKSSLSSEVRVKHRNTTWIHPAPANTTHFVLWCCLFLFVLPSTDKVKSFRSALQEEEQASQQINPKRPRALQKLKRFKWHPQKLTTRCLAQLRLSPTAVKTLSDVPTGSRNCICYDPSRKNKLAIHSLWCHLKTWGEKNNFISFVQSIFFFPWRMFTLPLFS